MIKNRYIQIAFRSVFLVIATYAMLLSIGALGSDRPQFYVWYTNLSNYLVLGVLFSELIINIVQVCKKESSGNIDTPLALKFVTLIGILVTFIILNFLLDTPFRAGYWTDVENVLMHFVNPILFLLDYILFRQRKSIKWYYPVLSTLFPLIYVAYIFIRASTIMPVDSMSNIVVYPYFFLDVSTLGVGGVIRWIFILVLAFILLGYLFYLVDKLYISDKHLKYYRKKKNA